MDTEHHKDAKTIRYIWAIALNIILSSILTQAACSFNGFYIAELRNINARFAIAANKIGELEKKQEELVAELSDGLAVALCRPEVRQLIDDVYNECMKLPSIQATGVAAAAASINGPSLAVKSAVPPTQTVGETCDTKKIEPAVIGADPEHRGRLLRLMISLRHEALYMRPNATEIISFRRDKLQRLAAQRLLMNTKFIIVSYYDRKEIGYRSQAIRRAELVRDKIRLYNNDITEDRIQIWLYSEAFKSGEIIDRVDLPQVGEPVDYAHSVWIFRADC